MQMSNLLSNLGSMHSTGSMWWAGSLNGNEKYLILLVKIIIDF